MPPRLPLLLTSLLHTPPHPPIAPARCLLFLLPLSKTLIRTSSPSIINSNNATFRQFTTSSPRRDASELPSEKESKRSSVVKNLTSRLDHLQAAIFTAGQKINDLTGYSGIEALKRDIELQEHRLSNAKSLVLEAKAAYKAAIARRSASQKEVNELLTRKNTWSPTDLERFTELYRSDHANEQAEIQAQNRLTEVEKEVENASSLLSKSILSRYHEEQVWSDKIRRASTWGTWMLMGINVVLFVIVQVGLEPWKRRRLVKSFEEKVQGMLKEERVFSTTSAATTAATAAAAVTVAGGEVVGVEVVKEEEEEIKKAIEETPLEAPEAVIIEEATAEAIPTEEQATVTEAEIEINTAAVGGKEEEEEGGGETRGVEEGDIGVFDLMMHRLNEYFMDTRISVPQIDVTLWVIEGFVVGVISTITLMMVSVLLVD